MKTHLALLSAGLLLLGSHPAAAQAPASPSEAVLTVSEAIGEALQRRPLLLGDAERVNAARARVTQARSGLLPRVDVQASATDGPLGAPPLGLGGLVGTPIKKHTGGSLNLVQTLLDFGRTRSTVRAREAEVEAGNAGLDADRNRVALEVQQAYFQVLQARRLVGVYQQMVEQRRLVARQAQTLQENGLASRVDVDLAELDVSQAQLALVRARNDVETAFASLSAAVGRVVPATTALEDPVPAAATAPAPGSPPPTGPVSSPADNLPSLDEALTDALQGRPELRQASAQVRIYEHLAAAARAGKRPLLTGVGSVGKINPVPLFESSDKPWAVGVSLTIPIFTGHLVEGQIEEARRNADASRSARAELSNSIRQQATAAVANLAASEESLRVAQAAAARAQDVLSLATQRYQAQLGSIVELTQAQFAYATAQNDLVRALYDRQLARAALAYATGRTPPAGTGTQGSRP